MKKLTSALVSLGILCNFCFTPIFAQTVDSMNTRTVQEESIESSDLFETFITKCFNDLTGFYVLDSNENNITTEFVEYIGEYYNNGDYEFILNVILENDLQLSYRAINSTESQKTRAFYTEPVSEEFYHLEYDSTGTFKKEWLTKLTAYITYNVATGDISSVSTPTLSLEVANFGSAFSPYLNNVKTSKSNKTSYAQLRGSYKMYADIGVSIGKFDAGATLDFGSHSDTFKAYPTF